MAIFQFSAYAHRCLRTTAALVFVLIAQSSYGQKQDSLTIAEFFSIPNLAHITNDSRDSVYKLIGNSEKLQDIYHYHDARLLLQTGKFDEALALSKQRVEVSSPKLSEYTKAKYFNVIGSVYANKQDIKRAIIYFEKALRICEESNEPVYASMMENNIANMYFTLVDYESAYKHIAKGYEEMSKHPEHPFYSNLIAILSISEAKIGKMDLAKKHGLIALKSAEKKGDLQAIVVANLALGEVANSEKNYEDAKAYLSTSLELSEKYNMKQFIVLNSIGLMVAYAETKDFKNAAEFGEKALELVKKGGDQTTIYSVKKNLATAYFKTNRTAEAYQLMQEAHEHFRETNSIENKKAINDLLLKYDSEKKEKELVASKNQLLKKQVERNQLMIVLGLLVLVIVSLAFIIAFIRHRNKNRIALLNSQQEKQMIEAVFEGEEIERERIARELHDGVASNLTAARYQLMANDRIGIDDKSQLEKILLQAHEDTRRLSHNLAPFSIEKLGFEKALTQFAQENSTEKCLVSAIVTPPGTSIPKEKATIIYRVAQELTQNAIKHADASEISIQVIVDKEISLIVEDDGKGFNFSAKKGSNGLSSVSKRATQLNGTFDVDSQENNGTITTFTIH